MVECFLNFPSESAIEPKNRTCDSGRPHRPLPAHEGSFPGYATSYAVEGEDIREMERKISDPEKRVRFSTYLCSIGFPPRSIYNRMLRECALKLA